MRRESTRSALFLASILPVSGFALASASGPMSPSAPASLLALLPAMFLAAGLSDPAFAFDIYLVPAVAAAVYLAASIPLILGGSWAWRVSAWLVGVLGLANATYIAVMWPYGVQYQGATYSAIVAALNLLCAVLVTTALLIARRKGTFLSLLVAHAGLFCWLNWVGFPWFGETL